MSKRTARAAGNDRYAPGNYVRIVVGFERPLFAELTATAHRRGISMSQLIREYVALGRESEAINAEFQA